MLVTTRNGIELLKSTALAEHRVPHGFTTRRHGFGARSNGCTDHAALTRALGLENVAFMRQVHGAEVREADAPRPVPECDGITTDRPGLGLIVHSADCVPILLWASKMNAVGAVHSGWRGTLADVATAAVDALVGDAGADPDELYVALGPAIRACCFEVGNEVVDAFVAAGRDADAISRPGPRGRRHVDLIEDTKRQLLAAGIRPERIDDCERCTACDNETFYSYRKEGAGVGRLMGVIAVKSS